MEIEVILVLVFVALFVYALYNSIAPSSTTTEKKANNSRDVPAFAQYPDKYTSLDMVRDALSKAGLESCNLIIGVDYTSSNKSQGYKTFNGRPLHQIDPAEMNPYQKVISIIGKTLDAFDEDQLIPAFGFGDITTKDRSVFSFHPDGKPCRGFEEVLERYSVITPNVRLSGPTSFAPIIEEAIKIVKQSGHMEYHILLIIADGQVTSEEQTIDAIEQASAYPLSIVMVGVGDGPWDMMKEFDDKLPKRKFDNFQFVDFHETSKGTVPHAAFALAALMEIPEQFGAIKRLGLLGKKVTA